MEPTTLGALSREEALELRERLEALLPRRVRPGSSPGGPLPRGPMHVAPSAPASSPRAPLWTAARLLEVADELLTFAMIAEESAVQALVDAHAAGGGAVTAAEDALAAARRVESCREHVAALVDLVEGGESDV